MAQGNRGFADLIAGAGRGAGDGARLPPRTGLLAARENRLGRTGRGHAP